MAMPAKRKRLSLEQERIRRADEEQAAVLWRRQIADITVQVTATEQISVEVDGAGNPIATATLLPPAASPIPPSVSASDSISSAESSASSASSSPASTLSTSPTLSSLSSFASLSSSASLISSESSSVTGLLTDSSSFSFPPTSSVATESSSSGFIIPTDSSSSAVITSALSSSSSAITSIPTAARGNGTAAGGAAAPASSSTPAPVVAGAVVGSIGGTAVVLLVLVLLARYMKHKGGSKRGSSRGGESTQGLHTTALPIMAHKPARRSFLPPVAMGWIDRLSGSHQKRSSSPTLPEERGFQKVAGRKLPSQFSPGVDEGPMARNFNDPDAIHPAAGYNHRQTGVTDTSSYYQESQGYPDFPLDEKSPIPLVPDHPNLQRDKRDTTQFFAGLPPRAASRQAERGYTPDRARSPHPNVPPLFTGARSATPSPPDEFRGQHTQPDLNDPQDSTLMPGPARTPNVYHAAASGGVPPRHPARSPNAPWVPSQRSPEPPGYTSHDSWPDSGVPARGGYYGRRGG